MVFDEMDELSEGFARALFSAFPHWERFAKVTHDDKTGASYIELDVPQEGTDRFLRLSTAPHEITMAFDLWHTHIGTFLGIDKAESVATALRIIESFVTEEAVVAISQRDGGWIGSSLRHRVAPGELKPNCTTRIFSWLGTYDETVMT